MSDADTAAVLRQLVDDVLGDLAHRPTATVEEAGRALGIGRSCIEFVRGLVTGLIFSEPADNLVPQARALQALETTLSAHLAGLRLAARQDFVSQR